MADETLRSLLGFFRREEYQLPSEMWYLAGLCEARFGQELEASAPVLARITTAKRTGVLLDNDYLAVCQLVKQGNLQQIDLALDVYRTAARRRGGVIDPPPMPPNNEANSAQLCCQKCNGPILSDFASPRTCGHIFHSLCLADSLSAKIREGVCFPSCPVPSCGLEVPLPDAKALPRSFRDRAEATAQIYNHHIGHPQSLVYCPTVTCPNRADFAGSSDLHCAVCKTSYCLRCRSIAHPGFDCEAVKPYLSSIELDSMFALVAKGVVLKSCQYCQLWNPKPPDKLRVQCVCGHTYCVVCGKWNPCPCRSL